MGAGAACSGDDAGRQLPKNVEAEAALLGAMMIDNRLADDLLDQLEPAHFFEPLHGRIFDAIRTLRRDGSLATPITLRPLFAADWAIETLGGVGYLAELTGSGAGLIGARDFARQIYDLAQLRALVEVGRALVDGAIDTAAEVNPRAQIEQAERMLAEVSEQGATAARATTFAQAWDRGFAHVEAVANGTATRGLQVRRLPEWNDLVGGMSAGQLILLGGRPGMGKTSVALAVAIGAAEAGHGVLFISREMPVDQLILRIIADLLFEAGSRATFDDVLSGRLSPADWQIATALRERLADLPLAFEEPATLNAARIPHLIRKHQRSLAAKGRELRLVIVDYLGLLDPPQSRGNREQEVGDTSRALKGAARSTGTALLALAQLNRGVEQREDKRPLLSDLRDSGSLEQDADTVVFAYRAEYYLRQTEPDPNDLKHAQWALEMDAARDRLDIYSAKVRQGAPQRRKVFFFGGRQAVRSADFDRTGGGAGWS